MFLDGADFVAVFFFDVPFTAGLVAAMIVAATTAAAAAIRFAVFVLRRALVLLLLPTVTPRLLFPFRNLALLVVILHLVSCKLLQFKAWVVYSEFRFV